MQVSTKRRLAVNCMIDLALREQAGPVALIALAGRQQVSLSCLEQLFARLRRAGLVQSARGTGGGYSLGREAAAISVAAIVDAVETGTKGADEGGSCHDLANDLSRRLDAVMQSHMAGIALAELVAGQRNAQPTAAVRPRRDGVTPRSQARALTASVPGSVCDRGALAAEPAARQGGRRSAAFR